MSRAVAPYLSPLVRRAAGDALRPGGLELTKRALEFCAFSPGDRVLDLGCGPGRTGAFLAGQPGLAVVGLDLEWQMLAEARASHPGLPLVQARAGAIPLATGSLAGVFAECVLSLAAEPADWLAECARVLVPGGRLVVSDLYFRGDAPGQPERLAAGCLGGARGRSAWELLMARAGFRVLLWEDHSRFLRELTARLVWEHGSAAAFWGAFCGGPDCQQASRDLARAKPGYFLLLAQAEGGSPWTT